jgi:hypothetical protein
LKRHSESLAVVLYVPAVDGAQDVPFQVWVMLEAVFQTAFDGSPVQFTFCVSATHCEFFQL